MNIVKTNEIYNSSFMQRDIYYLNRIYPFLNIQTIGNSILGKKLEVIKLGKGQKQVFYSASIHANEWITTLILMKFVEDYCKAFNTNSNLLGYSIRNLYKTTSIYIMPMINPDGVDLVTGTIDINSQTYIKTKNISNKFPTIPFPYGWKANINGVDLKNFQTFSQSYLYVILLNFKIFSFSLIEFSFEKLKYI